MAREDKFMQVNFLRGVPADEALKPVAAVFGKAYQAVLDEFGDRLVQYQTPGLSNFLGFVPLKRTIASRFGLPGDPDKRVICTNGGMETLSFLLRSFPPGKIATDAVTYDRVLQDIARHGHQAIGVAYGKDGVDLDALDAILATEDVHLFYQVGYHHNPLGTTVSLHNMETAAQVCARHATLHVIDIAYFELRYDGAKNTLVNLQEYGANTAMLGSFTKTLSPGTKCGFGILPERVVSQMTPVISNARLNPNYPTQAAINYLIESSFYDTHLQYLANVYRPRMNMTNQIVAKRFGHLSLPNLTGGFFLGLWLPGIVDENEFINRVKQRGVTIAISQVFPPGMKEKYCVDRQQSFFRLTFPAFSPPEIEFGINVIADIYSEMSVI